MKTYKFWWLTMLTTLFTLSCVTFISCSKDDEPDDPWDDPDIETPIIPSQAIVGKWSMAGDYYLTFTSSGRVTQTYEYNGYKDETEWGTYTIKSDQLVMNTMDEDNWAWSYSGTITMERQGSTITALYVFDVNQFDDDGVLDSSWHDFYELTKVK